MTPRSSKVPSVPTSRRPAMRPGVDVPVSTPQPAKPRKPLGQFRRKLSPIEIERRRQAGEDFRL